MWIKKWDYGEASSFPAEWEGGWPLSRRLVVRTFLILEQQRFEEQKSSALYCNSWRKNFWNGYHDFIVNKSPRISQLSKVLHLIKHPWGKKNKYIFLKMEKLLSTKFIRTSLKIRSPAPGSSMWESLQKGKFLSKESFTCSSVSQGNIQNLKDNEKSSYNCAVSIDVLTHTWHMKVLKNQKHWKYNTDSLNTN